MTVSDWSHILDAYEARLDAQALALREHAFDGLGAFTPPHVESPLPHALVERAEALLQRCRDLEHALATALAETAVAIARSDRARPTGHAAEPVYFDSHV